MMRSLLRRILARVNKMRDDTRQEGTRLPMDGDPDADKANMVIYRNVAAATNVLVDEDDPDGPVVWGTHANIKVFDERLRDIVARGAYFGTVDVGFAGNTDAAETGLDMTSAQIILRKWPVVVVRKAPGVVRVRGRWCDVQAAVAELQLADRQNASTDPGQEW